LDLQSIQSRIFFVSRVLNVILSHQPREELQQVLSWWSRYTSLDDLLLTYGGPREEFDKLPDVSRVFVSDPRLRANKTRQKQNYDGVFRAATQWLLEKPDRSFSHVYFAEFDHLPLISNLAEKLLQRLEEEDADVLGHGVSRVDNTSNVLYLYHLADARFEDFWRRISVRQDHTVVLRMLVTGSFWTRRAFTDVGRQKAPVPIYLELYLPTVAHYLGYRVRELRDQSKCVSPAPKPRFSIQTARQMGCWTVHPVKTVPRDGQGD
jgi:hypothetical protein